MSLKYDEVEYLLLNKDISDAVEDLKNGKKHAKRNLYKFVYFRRINERMYKELVKRFYKVNVRKKKKELWLFGYPIKDYVPILFFFSIIGAIGIILTSIENHNFWVEASTIYLLLAFSLWHYSTTDGIQRKDFEIADLKREVRNLEDIIEGNKNIIMLLEKEIENKGNNSQ